MVENGASFFFLGFSLRSNKVKGYFDQICSPVMWLISPRLKSPAVTVSMPMPGNVLTL